jgi:hypothetical protein
MAKKKYLDILKQGVERWNQWREEHPVIEPDLSGADLRGSNLNHANLNRALQLHLFGGRQHWSQFAVWHKS